jgi:hypothetical protein
MTRKALICVVVGAVWLSACSRTSKETVPPSSYPQPQDNQLVVGNPTDTYPAPRQEYRPNPTVNPYPGSGEEANPYAPTAGDENLTRGNAFVDYNTSQILMLKSNPPQFLLSLNGTLPDPCHQLRVSVHPPDEQMRINVEVYSLVEPGKVCTQILKEFEADIPLGSFSGGRYSVYVNDQLMGQFDS